MFLLLDYLEKTTNAALPHISSIRIYSDSEFLIMDDSSRRNLEVISNMRDGSTQYSLYECVDFTKTAMGGRLLRNWLLFPLTNLRQIEDRQAKVASFVENRPLLDKVKSDLASILDVERLAGRIAMERAHAKDLQALRASLEGWNRVKEYLGPYDFSFVSDENARTICELIEKSILEDEEKFIYLLCLILI